MKTKEKKKSEATVPREPTHSTKDQTKAQRQKSSSPSIPAKADSKALPKSVKPQDKRQKEVKLDNSWAAGLRDSSVPVDRAGKYRLLTKA